jgi:hypothetical protein
VIDHVTIHSSWYLGIVPCRSLELPSYSALQIGVSQVLSLDSRNSELVHDIRYGDSTFF